MTNDILKTRYTIEMRIYQFIKQHAWITVHKTTICVVWCTKANKTLFHFYPFIVHFLCQSKVRYGNSGSSSPHFPNTFNYKVLCCDALRAPSSPHISWHPQRGRKLKEGDRISHKADGGWAADHNYPKCYSNGTTSLYGQLRIPMLSNVLSQLHQRCSYPLVIFSHAAEALTQWLLNSQPLKDTTSVPTCYCWAL